MIKNTHPRRIAREAVLQALYASAMTGEDSDKILKDILNRRSYESSLIKYITDLFESAIDNKEWCEDQIKSRLNNWEFDRVAILDRLLLIVAISEIYFVEDVPPKVSISEAIEIAKIYCNEDSSSFVNGVLDKLGKKIRNKENE